jgi:hypothetical protein
VACQFNLNKRSASHYLQAAIFRATIFHCALNPGIPGWLNRGTLDRIEKIWRGAFFLMGISFLILARVGIPF